MRIVTTILTVLSVMATHPLGSQAAEGEIENWSYYCGDAGGSRYSPLTQINKHNVSGPRLAWEYHTGDVSDGSGGRRKGAFEATPIVVDGTMYVSTPFNRVIALDPEVGVEKWSFDPKINLRAPYSEGLINRGVALWTDAGTAGSRRRVGRN
jgi:quinoprotein glucose dehydrogenase